jgi:hypothetical protein
VNNDRNDRTDQKLPVTAELGDEGGSYGDATAQKETFEGGRGNPRVDPRAVADAGAGTETLEPDATRGPADDVVKHPTDR